MEVLLYPGTFFTIYGIVGIFGFQFIIPKRFRGQAWQKEYTRKQGFSWLLLGAPWLIHYAVFHTWSTETTKEVTIAMPLGFACAIPCIVYSYLLDKKYTALVEET